MLTMSELQQNLEQWLTNNSRHNVPGNPIFELNKEMKKVSTQYNPNKSDKVTADGCLYILKNIEAINFKTKTAHINTVYEMLQNNGQACLSDTAPPKSSANALHKSWLSRPAKALSNSDYAATHSDEKLLQLHHQTKNLYLACTVKDSIAVSYQIGIDSVKTDDNASSTFELARKPTSVKNSKYMINGKEIVSYLNEFTSSEWELVFKKAENKINSDTSIENRVAYLCNPDQLNLLSDIIKSIILEKIFSNANTSALEQRFVIDRELQSLSSTITLTLLEQSHQFPEYQQFAQRKPITTANIQIDDSGVTYEVSETLSALSGQKNGEAVIVYYDSAQEKLTEMSTPEYYEKFSTNAPPEAATIRYTLKVVPYQENKMTVELTEYHIDSPVARLQALQEITDTINPLAELQSGLALDH